MATQVEYNLILKDPSGNKKSITAHNVLDIFNLAEEKFGKNFKPDNISLICNGKSITKKQIDAGSPSDFASNGIEAGNTIDVIPSIVGGF